MLQNLVEDAKKDDNPRLFALAAKVHLEAFTKVKEAIDDMVVSSSKRRRIEIDTLMSEVAEMQVQMKCGPREYWSVGRGG